MLPELLTRPRGAIALFVFAMAMIPLNDALIKLMSDRLSIFQIMGIRAAFASSLLLLVPATIPSVRRLSFITWIKLCIRGACLVVAMLFFFLPLATLSLAEATSIFFTAPLLISVLSVPLLGERLGVFRISAVLIGLVGVLLIAKPGGDGFNNAYFLPLISATAYAAFQLITRHLRNEADVIAMMTVQNLIYFIIGILGTVFFTLTGPYAVSDAVTGFLTRGWQQPQWIEIGYMAAASLIVLTLSMASTNVYSNVEATYVAPFEYVALPTAVLWGILIWGDWPDLLAWAGMGLILMGGILMVYREHRLDEATASATPMRASTANQVAAEENDLLQKYEPNPFHF